MSSIEQLDAQILQIEAQLKQSAKMIATHEDLILKQKEKLALNENETAMFIQKTKTMLDQIEQELGDQKLIETEIR